MVGTVYTEIAGIFVKAYKQKLLENKNKIGYRAFDQRTFIDEKIFLWGGGGAKINPLPSESYTGLPFPVEKCQDEISRHLGSREIKKRVSGHAVVVRGTHTDFGMGGGLTRDSRQDLRNQIT